MNSTDEPAGAAALLRAARRVLAAAREGRRLAVEFTAFASRVTVRVAPGKARPPKGPTPCERDVLTTLQECRGVPTTTTRLLARLDAAGRLHGEATVKRALARMSRAGVIRASRKAPRGYRLPAPPPSPGGGG
jgi:hypothetical protein